ncbi:MAG: HD domain-containing protein [Deltaproteobacteria bacterium]|nr:HD domain-containing protein [Deltaproteobacteria bacterium]
MLSSMEFNWDGEKPETSEVSAPPQQKLIFIKDLKAQDEVQSTFLVKSKETFMAKSGKPYLALLLMDRTGEIDARVWENAQTLTSTFQQGDIIALRGRVNSYQNKLQLVVSHLVPSPQADLRNYLPASLQDPDLMFDELCGFLNGIKNPWIRDLSLQLLQDKALSERYKLCPAAKSVHHAYIGGLLQHSLQLVKVVDAISKIYPELDRDLLLFGAAFHDIGKTAEISSLQNFDYTDEGKLLGHISIGVTTIDQKIRVMADFPKQLELQLKHMVLSHHGQLEFGSPVRPQTLEAQVLHHLDDMDSKIDGIQTLIRGEGNQTQWTSFHKTYGQCYFRPQLQKQDKALK